MESGLMSMNNLSFYAYHGCLPEESIIGGNYLVDLNIFTDYIAAAKNDDLALTVNYCSVYEIVKTEMMIRSKLIESVAFRIASSLKKNLSAINRVEVKVTKVTPPVNGDVPSVSVTYII